MVHSGNVYLCDVISFPPAKLNVGLSIQSKREDGYHDIVTIMTPIPLYDILEVLPAERFSFVQTGLQIPADGKLNLCERAFLLMKEKYGIGDVKIQLRKQIPFGAGLGGGSADAAFVLKALNDLFNLSIKTGELENLAAQLGSDCPFFIDASPKLAKGRGEVLSPIKERLSGLRLVVLNPKIHVSTAFAYSVIVPKVKQLDWEASWNSSIDEWQELFTNDFEKPISEHFPLIAEIIQELKNQGALYAAMSGSGSSVFGLFDKTYCPNISRFQEYIILNEEI